MLPLGLLYPLQRTSFSYYSKVYNYLYTRVGEVRKPRQRGGEDHYFLKCQLIFRFYYNSSVMCSLLNASVPHLLDENSKILHFPRIV